MLQDPLNSHQLQLNALEQIHIVYAYEDCLARKLHACQMMSRTHRHTPPDVQQSFTDIVFSCTNCGQELPSIFL